MLNAIRSLMHMAVFPLMVVAPHLAQAQAKFQGTPYEEYRTADGCAFTDDSSGGNHDEWWLVSATVAECRNGLVQGPMLFTRAHRWTVMKSQNTHTQFAFFENGRYQGWMFSIYEERGFLFAKNYPVAYYLSRDDEAVLSPAAMKQKVNSLIDEYQRQSRRQGYAKVMKPFASKVMDLWQSNSRDFIQKLTEGVSNRSARVISLDDFNGVQNNATSGDAQKAVGRGARGD